jgi:probable HAF family extracellular repeat protein
VALGTLAGAAVEGFSAAFDVSDTGAVVGAAVDGSGSLTAILWPSTADLPMALAPLGAGNTFSAAYGINAGGMIVGEAENNDFESRAVLWTTAAADPIDLGALAGGLTSRAYVINDNNIIAGESDDAGGKRHAVIWEPNGIDYTIVDLGILDENGSTANGISAAGAVVGETEDASGQIRAVAWIPGPPTGEYTRRGLGAADIESSANGIAGSRIVGYTRIAGVNEAAVWDLTSIPPTLTQSIPATGPDSQAYAATATGMIVGKVGAAGFVVVP